MADKEYGRKTGSISRDDYEQELESSKWQVEREKGQDVQRELRQADKEAEAVNEARERADRDYNPDNPQEEEMEKEFRGE